jgi:hypothetical protein
VTRVRVNVCSVVYDAERRRQTRLATVLGMSLAGFAQEMSWILMQGAMELLSVEFGGRPSPLATCRHPFPVEEVPFTERVELSDHARVANPAAILRILFPLVRYDSGVYWYHSGSKDAVGSVEFPRTVVPPGTEDGFQFTAPERRGAMND